MAKTYLRRFLLVLNWVLISTYIVIIFNYYFPKEYFTRLFVLNPLIPYLLIINICYVALWAVSRNYKYIIINIVTTVIIASIFQPLYNFNDEDSDNTRNDVKILTFNSLNFGSTYHSDNPELKTKIINFIGRIDPDIVCFQEFDKIKENSGTLNSYPYQHIITSTYFNEESTLAIFSKHRFITKGSLNFSESSNNAIYADIMIQKDTIRVYNVHLESLEFRLGSFKRERPRRLLGRLNLKYKKQLEQAVKIKKHRDNSNMISIICGDFNNTSSSGIVRLIGANMNDSFIEKGHGFGFTYYFRFLPFRIDFIFLEPSLEILDHQNFRIELSDHFPIMATFRFQNP